MAFNMHFVLYLICSWKSQKATESEATRRRRRSQVKLQLFASRLNVPLLLLGIPKDDDDENDELMAMAMSGNEQASSCANHATCHVPLTYCMRLEFHFGALLRGNLVMILVPWCNTWSH